jgi:hypothetical protein
MKYGTNTLHVAFIFLLYIQYIVVPLTTVRLMRHAEHRDEAKLKTQLLILLPEIFESDCECASQRVDGCSDPEGPPF